MGRRAPPPEAACRDTGRLRTTGTVDIEPGQRPATSDCPSSSLVPTGGRLFHLSKREVYSRSRPCLGLLRPGTETAFQKRVKTEQAPRIRTMPAAQRGPTRRQLLGAAGAALAVGGWTDPSKPRGRKEIQGMYEVRRSNERGSGDHGWLKSNHTFSFADYYDPRFMGFGPLRVINEDRVIGGAGFPTHPHRDMEIISYVLEGGLEHKDSMGTGSIIRPGELQRMSAGTGVLHSEYNASKSDLVHFLQIWIIPERSGLEPSYEQKAFSVDERTNALRLLASRTGEQGSVTVHQDIKLYGSLLEPGSEASLALEKNRGIWVQVAKGAADVDGHRLEAGDGLAVVESPELKLKGVNRAELLVFDLPMNVSIN